MALNGPILAQVGRDGKTYAGRERSGVLEGIEMVLTGDKRLHSRGHKKPAVKSVDASQACKCIGQSNWIDSWSRPAYDRKH